MAHLKSKETITTVVVRGEDDRLYRRSAQAFIMNECGQFLGCTPVGYYNRDILQTVQGGVERGEEPKAAAVRESTEEIGLKPDDLDFVSVILPGDDAVLPSINDQGELEDETCREFRYPNESWSSFGISGEELYPFLFFAQSTITTKLNFVPRDPCARREIYGARWVNLESLALNAPETKMKVMQIITTRVHPVAAEYLSRKRIFAPYINTIVDQPYYFE